jgi:hypothetical protein
MITGVAVVTAPAEVAIDTTKAVAAADEMDAVVAEAEHLVRHT